jgi:LPS-assembly protein
MRRAGCAIHVGVKRAGALALSAALLLGVAPAAFAKPHHTTPTNANDPFKVTKPTAAQPDDGLGTRDVYVEADSMVDDRTNSLVTGEGHVEVRYQGRTLRADKVIYNSTTGATHAYGHIVIVQADGTTSYATEMELDDQFRAGVALGFSARLQDNVTIVANSAIHRNESVNVLRDARYTPCDICRKDGSAKEPTFSIQAEQITQDHDHGVVYYRHAIIRVKGVPVMALPFFWHADPTIDRRSGLLTPKIQYSRRRGLSYEQPYLFALSPSSELIVDPQLNTAVSPLLNLRYRQQFYSGLLDIRTGYTYGKLFDSHGTFGDDATNRSYILAKGSWQIDPRVTIGFGAEQVTDPTFFARYGVRQLFQDRGPFKTDTDRLISQVYVQRQDSQSYFSIAALDYESIRATVADLTTGTGATSRYVQTSDTSAAFPLVGPMIEARYNPRDLILGGRLNLLATAVLLNRSNTVIDVTDPTGINPAGPQPATYATVGGSPTRPTNAPSLTYKNSAQATAEADWRTDITFANGLRVSPFLEGRGDVYAIGSGVLSSGVNYGTLSKADNTVTRATGTLGFDASWPFIKPMGKGSLVLEPLLQAAVSPNVKPDANIPNEDSASFEFDETTLFSTHRFPGYDLYEGGARLNVGGRATADFGGGRSASLLVGRAFRDQPDLVFSAVSGLQGTSSDWITAVTITPIPGLSFFNRARSDADTWKVHREEAGVNLSIGRSSLSLRYRYDENGVSQIQCGLATCVSPYGGVVVNGSTVVGKVQNAELNGSTFVTKHWGVLANLTRDLQTRIWPMAQVGVFYQDECVRLDILYTHDETYSTVIGTSDAVTFRLTFTTLGTSLAPGTKAYDGR